VRIMRLSQLFSAAPISPSPVSPSLRCSQCGKTQTGATFWLTVMAAYYAAVIVKAVIWAENHGGFGAHNMSELIGVTLRTTTVDAGILLTLIFILGRTKREY
jgi:hypothetical protein